MSRHAASSAPVATQCKSFQAAPYNTHYVKQGCLLWQWQSHKAEHCHAAALHAFLSVPYNLLINSNIRAHGTEKKALNIMWHYKATQVSTCIAPLPPLRRMRAWTGRLSKAVRCPQREGIAHAPFDATRRLTGNQLSDATRCPLRR